MNGCLGNESRENEAEKRRDDDGEDLEQKKMFEREKENMDV